MRCHICDKELSDKEVSYNEDLQGYEPCTECLDIALDAAYSGGVPDDERQFSAVDSSFDEVEAQWSFIFSSTVNNSKEITDD